MSESQQLQTTNGGAAATAPALDDLQKVVYESLAMKGDISGLKPEDKVRYMQRLCESLGLNPYTQPFLPLTLGGKEVLYATRGCTDQLSSVHKLTREIINTQQINDVYIATAKVAGPEGRFDISTGAVSIGNLKGDALANALMKAETKAKRRATLCYCGLGFLDETEIETIPADRVDRTNGQSQNSQSRLATKGQLVDKANANGSTPAPATAAKEMPVTEHTWRTGIERLMRLANQSEQSVANALKNFDDNPEKREAGWIAVMKTVLKKLIDTDLWPYNEEGTTAKLELYGITGIDDASRGQLEALFTHLTDEGVLTRFADYHPEV
jgi:hypothetical protein